MPMKVTQNLFLFVLPGLVSLPVLADPDLSEEEFEAITAKWKCKYCPDLAEEPWYLDLNAGVGYVSNDSFKFGQYNGLNEKGPFLILDIDAMYRDDKGNYFEAYGDRLGLDVRSLELEGGKQGTYKLNFEIDQIYKYDLDTSRTPYNGDSIQTLPGGWVTGSTTADFSSLDAALHNVDILTKRRNVKLGGTYIQNARWSYDLAFNRQTKDGNQTFGSAIGSSFAIARSAILARPVDFVTDQTELAANYKYSKFSGRIALLNSSFDNKNEFLRWQNAFDLPPGATEGQSAVDPDNDMQQLLLSGNYRGIRNVQLAGYFSVARMSQNDQFLPYTVNSGLTTSPLPRTSLDGKVMAYNANLKANWQFRPNTRFNFLYEYQEQDNSTPVSVYEYVVADAAVSSTPRFNNPYSFRRQKFNFDARYRFENRMKLTGGAKYTTFDRTFQEVDRQDETTLWGQLANNISAKLYYNLKLEVSDRKADSYEQLPEVTPPENPLMRKYNMADRDGLKGKFGLTYSARDDLIFNFELESADYDYPDSEIGMTALQEFAIGLDAQYQINNKANLTGFIQNTRYDSDQAGSQTVTTPDWFASNEDTIVTAGLGTNYQVIEDKLRVGLDYIHAESTGKINVQNETPFPDLKTSRDTVKLYADYQFQEKLALKVTYQFERYREDNWYIDNVTPDTIDNVLTLGEIAPDYDIGVLWASVKYSF